MVNRRSLLLAAGALTLNQVLAGCQTSRTGALHVQLLEGSIPAQILQEFQRQFHQAGINFTASQQLAELFALLQTWKQPPAKPSGWRWPIGAPRSVSTANLSTLGDYWLAAAIQQNLIQPFPVENFAGWQQLPAPWQQLVRRDPQGQPSPSGSFWAAPYRWGSVVIAYNVKRFQALGWTPTDWKDLWRPELKGYLSLLDSPRITLGLTLKKLSQSVNTSNLDAVPNLSAELKALNQQVKFYNSDAYLQPLLLEDSWIAVGWSTEVLPVIERDQRIAAVVPSSGTILTSDLWVCPAPAAKPAADLQRWIEFCWQPGIAAQLSLLSLATSPVIVSDRTKLPESLRANSVLLPPAEVLDRSEFLLPVANSDQYQNYWETMRRTG